MAIHLVLDFFGENSLTQTGPYITQKAYVKPNMKRIEAKIQQLEETENAKHDKALRIILSPSTLLALNFQKMIDTNIDETDNPK